MAVCRVVGCVVSIVGLASIVVSSNAIVNAHDVVSLGAVCGTIGVGDGSPPRSFVFDIPAGGCVEVNSTTSRDTYARKAYSSCIGHAGGRCHQEVFAGKTEECLTFMEYPSDDCTLTGVPASNKWYDCHPPHWF